MDKHLPPGLLRTLAILGAVALPMAWLVSLSGRPELQATNLLRVLGAVVVAGTAWIVSRRKGDPLPWQRSLASGIVGSLGVTALSILLPTLGAYALSGWLMSGVVGGGVVALAAYASR